MASAPCVERARAQSSTQPSATAAQVLPPVPRLQLSLPAPAGSFQREGIWPHYWRGTSIPAEWRRATNEELRLELPMARLQLGPLSLGSLLVTTPGRERDCLPDCRSPQWSSVLRLQHELGDLAPLRQAGPQLELRGARAAGNVRQVRGYVGAGFGGKF